MTQQSYSEKLRDPRWQKKRLEILERDNWACTICFDKGTTLHVHHKNYYGNPWEVGNEDLKTLCAHCHLLVSHYVIEDEISPILKSITGKVIWFIVRTRAGEVSFYTYNTNIEQWQGVVFGDKSWKKVFEYLKED